GVPGVVKEVRAADARTLQIVLSRPYAPLLTVLAHPGFGITKASTGPDGNPVLIGSGPYRVVDGRPGRLVLEAVTGHWSGGAPGRTARLRGGRTRRSGGEREGRAAGGRVATAGTAAPCGGYALRARPACGLPRVSHGEGAVLTEEDPAGGRRGYRSGDARRRA